MTGIELEFLDEKRPDFIFLMLGLHDCDGCWTLNLTVIGIKVYIGWMKQGALDALKDRLAQIKDRSL